MAATVLPGCSTDQHSFRFKFTMVLEVDGETKTGSTVTQHSISRDGIIGNFHFGERGQALYIDLGPGRRPFIALMNKRPRTAVEPYEERHVDTNGVFPGRALAAFGQFQSSAQAYQSFNKSIGRTVDVALVNLPRLVTLVDKMRPETVIQIDPNDPSEALQRSVSITRATIELTRETVSSGLTKQLPWIDQRQRSLDGSGGSKQGGRDLANFLTLEDFRLGAR